MRRSVLSLLVIVAVLLASPLAVAAEEKPAEFYVKRVLSMPKKESLTRLSPTSTRPWSSTPG